MSAKSLNYLDYFGGRDMKASYPIKKNNKIKPIFSFTTIQIGLEKPKIPLHFASKVHEPGISPKINYRLEVTAEVEQAVAADPVQVQAV